MQNKPVDMTRLGIARCEIAPEPRVTPDGEVRRDRDGNPQWITGVVVRQLEGRRMDAINVIVSGAQPTGIKEGAEVRLTNLWANEWEVDGRRGTSWRADAITPVPPASGSGSGSASSAPAGGARGKGGEQ
ncbi:hypothetical protein ACFWY6_01820 [Streptomyces sp. NPDC059037]|uniref:hypothetical protein n=1 Tax=Streptomyces sp. NPDC059037 TaxID=3346710 RepID=UPI0036ADDF89